MWTKLAIIFKHEAAYTDKWLLLQSLFEKSVTHVFVAHICSMSESIYKNMSSYLCENLFEF